jgi:hypothetical protein
MNKDEQEKFITILAQSNTGKDLVRYLKAIETEYADIRNLKGVSADVRIDALTIWREALLDKLLVLSGEVDPPNNDEYR